MSIGLAWAGLLQGFCPLPNRSFGSGFGCFFCALDALQEVQ